MAHNITKDLIDIGVNSNDFELFEGQFNLFHGISYNSYILMDEKNAIFDTVDIHYEEEWLGNIHIFLEDKKPTYLILHHMEPDHSACIMDFLKDYPDTILVGNIKTFQLLEQFFHQEVKHKLVVKDQDQLVLGTHTLTFIMAPMVHWPEVMFSYEEKEKILFSADAFGKFGSTEIDDSWVDEAARYYFGIVAKFGPQVANLLKKLTPLSINMICPLHGRVLNKDIEQYIHYYDLWSKYEDDLDGVAIICASIYGHTGEAVDVCMNNLACVGAYSVKYHDLTQEEYSYAIADAFRYKRIIFASVTYNNGLFPNMNDFLSRLIEKNFQNKIVGFIENGSWAPMAYKCMKEKLSACKNITFVEPVVTIKSSLSEENIKDICDLAENIMK